MIIDTHSHLVTPEYARLLAEGAGADPEFASVNARRLDSIQTAGAPETRIDSRLEEMDASSIDIAVLSLPPPGIIFGDKRMMIDAATVANDELAAAVEANPDRFVMLANLPFPHTEECQTELKRVAGWPGVRGVSLLAASGEWTVDDERLEPVLTQIAELGLPIVLHPTRRSWPNDMKDWGLTRSLGAMIASTISASRLILSGMLDRVSDLEVIMPHLGGTLLYLEQRYEDVGRGDAEHEVGDYLRSRFHFDTCSLHPPALHCAIESVGGDRLILGSDYPFRGSMQRAVDHVAESVASPDLRAKILGRTAARWFGRR